MSDKGKEGNINLFGILCLVLICIIISELIDFKARRVSTFNKNLLELAEWEIKHAQVHCFRSKWGKLHVTFTLKFFVCSFCEQLLG